MNAFFIDLFNSLLEEASQFLAKVISETIGNFFFFEKLASQTINITKIEDLYKISYGLAITYIVIKLLLKGFMTYILERDGDPDTSPLNYVRDTFIALCFMAGFSTIYEKFVEVFIYLMNKYLQVLFSFNFEDINTQFTVTDIIQKTSGSIGIIQVIFLLIFVIIAFMIILNLCKVSFQLFILRVGFPFACVGALNSDYGLLSAYVKLFFQIAFTIVIQIISLVTGLALVISPNTTVISLFLGIAVVIGALKTPQFLSNLLVQINGSSGSGLNKASTVAHTASTVKSLIG